MSWALSRPPSRDRFRTLIPSLRYSGVYTHWANMLKCIRITGDSMAPALRNGDYVLLLTRGFQPWLKPGRIVAFDHGADGLMIKRLHRRDPAAGTWEVRGENTLSIAGCHIGPVPDGSLRGLRLLSIRAPKP